MKPSPALLPPALLSLACLALSACCSGDPDRLPELSSTEPPSVGALNARERRETLACLAQDAREDPGLHKQLVAAARIRVDPKHESDPAVRATAARTLSFLGDTPSVPALATLLSAEADPMVRRAQIEALSHLGGRAALGVLRERARADSDAGLRQAAFAALARFRDPESTETLLAGLSDRYVGVRLHARRGLEAIYRTDQGLEAAHWRTWLKAKEEAARDKTLKAATKDFYKSAGTEEEGEPGETEEEPGEEYPEEGDPFPEGGEDTVPKPGDYSFPKTEFTDEPKPARTEPKPAKTEPKPAKTEPKPAKTEPKPARAEPKPAKTAPKPAKPAKSAPATSKLKPSSGKPE